MTDGELAGKLADLIGEYFCIGWQEGRENRTHDTEDGVAAAKWHEIRQAIKEFERRLSLPAHP